MHTAQVIIGFTILIGTAVASLLYGFFESDGLLWPRRAPRLLLKSGQAFFVAYAGMTAFFATLWLFAWIGIFLREIAQYLSVAVLYPWKMLF